MNTSQRLSDERKFEPMPESTTVLGANEEDALEDTNWQFITIPLVVLFGILLLSALVYLMARNRRRLAHVYCKRKTVARFNFHDDSESPLEESEHGDNDIDDPTQWLLKGKLQIDNIYYSARRATQRDELSS